MALGRVVSYMREERVKYGFLTTYEATVFIKRAADLCFEISTPIDQNDTNPTVRECFLGFCVLASTDSNYFEPPGFNSRLVSLLLLFSFLSLPITNHLVAFT